MNPAEQYILNQEQPYRDIILHLQSVIERSIPDAQLLYKWRMPFYYVGKRPLCYIHKSRDYVDLGFWNAQYLTLHLNQMVSEKRKKMKSLRYRNLEEIDDALLQEVLQEAYAVRDRKFW